MIRSFFLALGIAAVILGGECLFVDEYVLRIERKPEEPSGSVFLRSDPKPTPIRWSPEDWVAWSMMSAGAVTILYAVTLPKKGG
ncbi:Hypothetical protein PBC10988_33880 [Planctomycetales bacterium 10988]|nr:Hypothetical protein PBC10988_33880 [Planctomycetales bacterium 10988]